MLCCALLWLYIDWFPISIRLTSLALWQSNDCHSASKEPWWIWINTSCEFIMDDCITTTKQSTTKPCAYFLGYTVYTLVTHLTDIYFHFETALTTIWKMNNGWPITDSHPYVHGPVSLIKTLVDHGRHIMGESDVYNQKDKPSHLDGYIQRVLDWYLGCCCSGSLHRQIIRSLVI